jgi:hypothetical protein
MFEIPWASFITLALVASLAGCASTQSPAAPAPTSATAETGAEPPASSAERPPLTAEDCTAQGGTVVGDIGDGAIHRPDYRCPSGAEPSGTITSSGGGPISVEGSVCCPG